MKEPEVNQKLAEKLGLKSEEYERILKILGRKPTYTELGIFSALWSEHCSYKSSKKFLKRFPTEGPQVIQGPGENAGVVDIGDGLAIVFKMESHNHPSYIEPYQGAATGVGGILRDIFTMGARPIANMDSLHFGEPEFPRMKYLVEGVVAGIGDYGNCIGVPTVAGETYFEKEYNYNILVNAFTLGIARKDKIFYGRASGPGNKVLYVGSRTGRDGIHGATMASEEFSEDTEGKKPTVQVGDPFTEKLLLEACLEVMEHNYIVGIQDMGAAGLTSSSFEMAGRANTGMILYLDRIPTREEGMTPYEILLSESQERMLLVVKQGYEEKVKKIFQKWDLQAVEIGEIIEEPKMVGYFHGEKVFDLPVHPLTEEAPVYDRPRRKPRYIDEIKKFDEDSIPQPADFNLTIKKLLLRPNLISKKWIYRQYDHMVQINTVLRPGGDAALLRVKNTSKKIGMVVESNGRYTYLDPLEGSKWIMAEAAINLATVGAKPLAITDCLNFGNPEKPEIMWQFEQSIEGLSQACEVLGTPVVSGNVSFYNETNGKPILPTPAVGMVGLVEEVTVIPLNFFKKTNHLLYLIGDSPLSLAGSEYLKMITGQIIGNLPKIELKSIKKLVDIMLKLWKEEIIESAHDIAEGGLAISLLEMSLGNKGQIGFKVKIDAPDERIDRVLFSESPGRIIVEVSKEKEKELRKIAQEYGIQLKTLGVTIPERGIFEGIAEFNLIKLYEEWDGALEKMLK